MNDNKKIKRRKTFFFGEIKINEDDCDECVIMMTMEKVDTIRCEFDILMFFSFKNYLIVGINCGRFLEA